ncbi:nuclear transport factor 2 family protein [Burkholderia oklahomensis]|uniref:YybH family protein n=1 Tax=Burkholderia oklahomensis TaxID=342113 RepID=UPI0026525BEE|nr:nuclear transport factor 2 family protein [Burkholderia oklahomensis]MDN7672447.1 nuclear transport factor 2 family protein [Burkholderia oklahomensis]
MTDTTPADIRHIHAAWHDAVVRRDLDALMALYADDAILETPLIVAVLRDRADGVLQGSAAIRTFFAAGFRQLPNELARWHRTDTFFTNGRQLIWEYPRETPQGDQVDLIESIDVAGARIVLHRVYWGWVGFRTLVAAMKRAEPAA